MTYAQWLVYQVTDEAHPYTAYGRMFTYLMSREYYWIHPYDRNREEDGLYLRYMYETDAEKYGDEPEIHAPPWCSLLEVLVALAIRCENEIMDDPDSYPEPRTPQWFWTMMHNVGLDMPDYIFSTHVADDMTNRLLRQEYEPNGVGGLFPVENSRYDMREMDLWQQMNFYMEKYYPT